MSGCGNGAIELGSVLLFRRLAGEDIQLRLSSDPYYFSGGSQGRISSFGYGVGISAGILVLVVTVTLMSFFCLRTSSAGGRAAVQPPSRRQRPEEEAMADVEAVCVLGGLDELASYPKVTYAEAKGDAASTTASCCSICLADYSDVDTLRLLPECGHLFHVDCVDPWLKSRPTCPMCRASPVPSPLL